MFNDRIVRTFIHQHLTVLLLLSAAGCATAAIDPAQHTSALPADHSAQTLQTSVESTDAQRPEANGEATSSDAPAHSLLGTLTDPSTEQSTESFSPAKTPAVLTPQKPAPLPLSNHSSGKPSSSGGAQHASTSSAGSRPAAHPPQASPAASKHNQSKAEQPKRSTRPSKSFAHNTAAPAATSAKTSGTARQEHQSLLEMLRKSQSAAPTPGADIH